MIPITALKALEATSSYCVLLPCTWQHFEPLLVGLSFG